MSPVSINNWSVGQVNLPKGVEPGKLVEITFKVKPRETGCHNFQTAMMNRNEKVFGQSTEAVQILVTKVN